VRRGRFDYVGGHAAGDVLISELPPPRNGRGSRTVTPLAARPAHFVGGHAATVPVAELGPPPKGPGPGGRRTGAEAG
jgi:hypothetical protein